MNKPAMVFGMTTFLFAAAAVYLAWQLHIEQQRTFQVAQLTTSSLSSGVPAQRLEAAVTRLDTRQTSLVTPRGEAQTEIQGQINELPMLDAKGYLRMLENSDARADAVRAAKASLRTSSPGLLDFLGLSGDDGDHLLDLLAEQMVASQVAMLRCQTTKGCDFRQGDPDESSRKQELETLLGTARYSRYETYQASLIERTEVNRFRALLPATHAMSDDQLEQLVAALAEERVRLHREVAQQGGEVNGEGTLAGMTYYPNTNTTAAQQIESVARYSARLRERAGQILNARQSAVFNQNQDDLMASVRATLLQREAAASQSR